MRGNTRNVLRKEETKTDEMIQEETSDIRTDQIRQGETKMRE